MVLVVAHRPRNLAPSIFRSAHFSGRSYLLSCRQCYLGRVLVIQQDVVLPNKALHRTGHKKPWPAAELGRWAL